MKKGYGLLVGLVLDGFVVIMIALKHGFLAYFSS
jgi:hypothetical protein